MSEIEIFGGDIFAVVRNFSRAEHRTKVARSSGPLATAKSRRPPRSVLAPNFETRIYSGPAKVFLWRSATRTANTAASVRCFIPSFKSKFET